MRTNVGSVLILGAIVASTWGATHGTDVQPVRRAGTIAGTVSLEPPPPPRRTANRYADRVETKVEQSVPAVVYLRGQIAGPPPAGYVADPEMMQRDSLFAPAGVALMVGGSVSFPNGDPFFHNVFAYSSAKTFDLGRYPEGESKEVQFDKVGVIDVACEVHDHMRGIIVVTENPYHAIVADDGSFSIAGVPPGEYTLVAWHTDYEEVERTVVVTDGAVTRIEVELPL